LPDIRKSGLIKFVELCDGSVVREDFPIVQRPNCA
jgi:hypothetical protein